MRRDEIKQKLLISTNILNHEQNFHLPSSSSGGALDGGAINISLVGFTLAISDLRFVFRALFAGGSR